MKNMPKTLYVRSFNETYHNKLNDISQQKGVSVGSIIEEAVGEWIKNTNQKIKQHNLILYSNEEELTYFLKKMEDLTKQDWSRICLGPENHKGKEFLKKKHWKDITVLPYVRGLKNPEKYASKVFGLADKESSGKDAVLIGFMTGDVASRFNLKKSIDLEKISNDTINSGIVFCPFKINNLTGNNMVELFELINEHDKVFVIKNNEIFEMNLDKTNHSKLLLT
jgi:hypothetical protein